MQPDGPRGQAPRRPVPHPYALYGRLGRYGGLRWAREDREQATRNTFDINAIPVLKQASHLPVIADPSHGTGKWEYVESVSLAAIAAGADGLILEVHHDPENAQSDGRQSLKPEKFAALVEKARQLAPIVGRQFPVRETVR